MTEKTNSSLYFTLFFFFFPFGAMRDYPIILLYLKSQDLLEICLMPCPLVKKKKKKEIFKISQSPPGSSQQPRFRMGSVNLEQLDKILN